jgi:DNA-binding phage protein
VKITKPRRTSLKALGVKSFEAADYLTDDEAVSEYLTAALEDPNPDMSLTAIKNVARVSGTARAALSRACALRSRASPVTLLEWIHEKT